MIERKGYRGHTTRLQVLATIGLIIFALVLAAFQLWLIYKGVVKGEILGLGRRSRETISLIAEPGWFGFNILVRSFLSLLFVAMAYVLYRLRLKAEVSDL